MKWQTRRSASFCQQIARLFRTAAPDQYCQRAKKVKKTMPPTSISNPPAAAPNAQCQTRSLSKGLQRLLAAASNGSSSFGSHIETVEATAGGASAPPNCPAALSNLPESNGSAGSAKSQDDSRQANSRSTSDALRY